MSEHEKETRPEWGVNWHLDKRVNIGHLLTTFVIAGSLFIYVQQQDTRLTILEERQSAAATAAAIREANLTSVITDLKISLERLNQRLERFADGRARQ